MTDNFNGFTENSLSDGVLDRQFNLLYLAINKETSDDTAAQEQFEEDEEEEAATTEETWSADEEATATEEPYVYTYTVTANILVYDIPKNNKTLLFAEGELEEGATINSFYFEQGFDAQNAKMLFNTTCYNLRSNYNLYPREPKNRLLVEVYHNSKAEYQLWVCDKWGYDKQCIARWTNSSDFVWHLDMFNEVIRLLNWDGESWYIVEYPW